MGLVVYILRQTNGKEKSELITARILWQPQRLISPAELEIFLARCVGKEHQQQKIVE